MHVAAFLGRDSTAAALVKHGGASVAARTVDGACPLHFACHGGKLEAAKLLLACGADPEAIAQARPWRDCAAGDVAKC